MAHRTLKRTDRRSGVPERRLPSCSSSRIVTANWEEPVRLSFGPSPRPPTPRVDSLHSMKARGMASRNCKCVAWIIIEIRSLRNATRLGYPRPRGLTLLGRVANRVIATGRCDVLVVPDQTVSVTSRNRCLDRCSPDVITGVEVTVPLRSAD